MCVGSSSSSLDHHHHLHRLTSSVRRPSAEASAGPRPASDAVASSQEGGDVRDEAVLIRALFEPLSLISIVLRSLLFRGRRRGGDGGGGGGGGRGDVREEE